MHLYLPLLFTLSATLTTAQLTPNSTSQLPTNASFQDLIAYLPFINTTASFFLADPRASNQLATAPSNPVTIFIDLDLPYQQFLETPLPPGLAGETENASVSNEALQSDLLQYLQIDGVRPSTTFNGTQFLQTRFNDTTYENVTGGERIEVFRNETNFYIGTGINFKSNVLIPDLTFAGGILHIVDTPFAPPYSIASTGIVLNISILAPITAQLYQYPQTQAPLNISTAPDITVFAVQNSVADTLCPNTTIGSNYNYTGTYCSDAAQLSNYIVPGQVLYSTNLTNGVVTAGTALPARGNASVGAGAPLVVTTDSNGDIFVNNSRIIQRDIITSNGVVQVLER
ncbi:hypothetical protein JMJ35_005283 [Cladonia borealis]|uniref:FAS1 domain-containing protein n=1 Tax=Cladonia borealis TaxID=184061 RepID=A0AA39QZQ4_9LECA|nr:hypothetical protein JMJ35_005283 [Cladonia borealis]